MHRLNSLFESKCVRYVIVIYFYDNFVQVWNVVEKICLCIHLSGKFFLKNRDFKKSRYKGIEFDLLSRPNFNVQHCACACYRFQAIHP